MDAKKVTAKECRDIVQAHRECIYMNIANKDAGYSIYVQLNKTDLVEQLTEHLENFSGETSVMFNVSYTEQGHLTLKA